jgi:hypothetical protein
MHGVIFDSTLVRLIILVTLDGVGLNLNLQNSNSHETRKWNFLILRKASYRE